MASSLFLGGSHYKYVGNRALQKSKEFVELGLDTILAFEILIRWTSEDHCKRCISGVPPPLPPSPEPDTSSMPSTQSGIWFQWCPWACSCSMRWSGLALCWAKLQKNMFLL